MRLKTILSAACFGLASIATAQNIADYVNPYSGVVNDQQLVYDIMEAKYPGYKQQVQQTFDRNKGYINMKSGTHTVNVVVHVVYKSPAENLPDSVIYDQIEVLNQDFQRQNADTNNLRAIFQPIAGSPNIQFNLASIERVSTTATFSATFSGLPDNVKQSSQGGSNAWDTEHYVNIWICKLESAFGALFGYAYPPAGLPNWPQGQPTSAPSPELDGIVLDYRTIGRNNPNPYPKPQGGGNFVFIGRTATHEVGHYFGMRHIWGDGGGFFGGDSCGEDDGIADTPNQGAQSNFDCNTNNNTCIDSIGGQPDPNDMPDLIENYMDYSDESCSNMWTQEQAAFMRNVVENERVGLITPVSIEELKLENSFSIYPNPSNGDFFVKISQPVQQRGKIKVINVLGEVIDERTVQEKFQGKLGYSVSGFSNGVYIVKLQQGSQSISKRLIVQ